MRSALMRRQAAAAVAASAGSSSSNAPLKYRIISYYKQIQSFFKKKKCLTKQWAFKTAQVTAELAAIVALQNSDGLQWKLSYHCLEKEH